MGENRTGNGPEASRARVAGAAWALALAGLAAPALGDDAPAAGAKAGKAPAGRVVRFQETRGANVLYHQEKGGMAAPAGAPVDAKAAARPGAPKPAAAPLPRLAAGAARP